MRDQIKRDLRAVKPEELRSLYRKLVSDGYDVHLTRGGHFAITTPTGTVFGPRTTSDTRSIHRVRSKLRRAGIAI